MGNDHLWAPAYPIDPAVEQRVQDYDKAKQLLSDAGMTNVKVTLEAERAGNTPNYAVLLKEMGKPGGFDINVKIIDQPTWYGSGDHQPWLLSTFGITGWANRPIPTQTINAALTCKAIWNSAHYCNDAFDSVIKQYDAEVDEGKRVDLATQACQMLLEDTPYIISYFTNTLRSAQPYVKGVDAPVGSNLDITKAWLDK